MKSVDLANADQGLAMLVSEVEREGEPVQICRNGVPIAVLRPVLGGRDVLSQDPRLKVIFHEDPSLPLGAEDWPEAYR
jgi:antitoxin (DNA-binding transcriptional repressor) of toxin-antitoxin stability system